MTFLDSIKIPLQNLDLCLVVMTGKVMLAWVDWVESGHVGTSEIVRVALMHMAVTAVCVPMFLILVWLFQRSK